MVLKGNSPKEYPARTIMRAFLKNSEQRAAISVVMMLVAVLAVGAIAKSEIHLLHMVQ
jgi:hypothetical protein